MTEPLDRLLRDAAGETPDPVASRRAVRAGLAPELARRRRGEKRAHVRLTLAMAAGLLVVLCGQLGSDDFVIHKREYLNKAGKERTAYEQGIAKESVVVGESWAEAGRTEADVAELLQQRAAKEMVLVGVQGFQVGDVRHFIVTREYMVNGKFMQEGESAEGQAPRIPPQIKAYLGAAVPQAIVKLEEISGSRAADFVESMTLNGLVWNVSGWRVALPGHDGFIIYYRGLRADGVRSRDGSSN